jgi:hypothetical protein
MIEIINYVGACSSILCFLFLLYEIRKSRTKRKRRLLFLLAAGIAFLTVPLVISRLVSPGSGHGNGRRSYSIKMHEGSLYLQGLAEPGVPVELQGDALPGTSARLPLGYARVVRAIDGQVSELEVLFLYDKVLLSEHRELHGHLAEGRTSPLVGNVVRLDTTTKTLILNIGKRSGVKDGAYYHILGEPITDIDAKGSSLGREVIGSLKIVDRSLEYSNAKLAEIKNIKAIDALLSNPESRPFVVLTTADNVATKTDEKIFWASHVVSSPQYLRNHNLHLSRVSFSELAGRSQNADLVLKAEPPKYDEASDKFSIDMTVANRSEDRHYLINALGLFILDTKTLLEFDLLAYELRGSAPITPKEVNFKISLPDQGRDLFETRNTGESNFVTFENNLSEQNLALKLPPKEFDYLRLTIDLGYYAYASFLVICSWNNVLEPTEGNASSGLCVGDTVFLISRRDRDTSLSDLLAQLDEKDQESYQFNLALRLKLAEVEPKHQTAQSFSVKEYIQYCEGNLRELRLFTTLGRIPNPEVGATILRFLQWPDEAGRLPGIIAAEECAAYKPHVDLYNKFRTEILRMLRQNGEQSAFAVRALKQYGTTSDLQEILTYYDSHPERYNLVANALATIFRENRLDLIAVLTELAKENQNYGKLLEELSDSSPPKFDKMSESIGSKPLDKFETNEYELDSGLRLFTVP